MNAPSLLSRAQIEQFRAQAKVKREAVFLAPQLIEHVAMLNDQLSRALYRLEMLKEAAHVVADAFDAATSDGAALKGDRLALIRTSLTRLLSLAGHDPTSVHHRTAHPGHP